MMHYETGGPGQGSGGASSGSGAQGGPGESSGGQEGCCRPRGHGGARCGPSAERPFDDTAEFWEAAFWRAMREVHVDILKERIRKKWGTRLEAVADEVVDAMYEEWKASMARDAARERVRAAVARAVKEGPQ